MAGRSGGREQSRARLAAMVVVSLLFVLPLVFMVTGSLRTLGQAAPRTPELLPSPLAGFAMARLPRRAGSVLVALSFVALMVPTTALIVSRLALFRMVGATGTLLPLVAPAFMGTSPFYVLLFYWSFRRLPADLYEAAELEGAGPFTTWWRVAMPLVRPITVAVGVLTFVVTWSNFLDPLVYLNDPATFTMPLGLKQLSQLDRVNYPIFLAGAVAATAPVVLAFVYVQRHFLSDLRRAGWLGR